MDEGMKKAIRYIINEAQKNPDQSVRDMANEAFCLFDIPLLAEWSHDDREPIELKHRVFLR